MEKSKFVEDVIKDYLPKGYSIEILEYENNSYSIKFYSECGECDILHIMQDVICCVYNTGFFDIIGENNRDNSLILYIKSDTVKDFELI